MKEPPLFLNRILLKFYDWFEAFVEWGIHTYEQLNTNPRFFGLFLLVVVIEIYQLGTQQYPYKYSYTPPYHHNAFEPSPPLHYYIGLLGGNDKLYTIRADGTELTKIAEVAPLRLVAAQWSPDGRSILFLAVDSYSNSLGSLYVMSSTSGDKHLIAEKVAWDFQWMADSLQVVFRAAEKNSTTYTTNLYHYALDTRAITTIADRIVSFRLSDNEQRLLMTQDELKDQYQESHLATANIDGSGINPVVLEKKTYHLVEWLSENEFLYLEGVGGNGYYHQLHRSNQASGVSSQLTNHSINVGVALSPDERYVAYVEVEDRDQLVIAPLSDISPITPLMTTTLDVGNHQIYDIYQIHWSTNGKGLALMGYRPLQNLSDSMEGQIHLIWFADPKVAKYAIPTSSRQGIWLPNRATFIYETEAPMYSQLELYDLESATFTTLGPFDNFDWRLATEIQE